MSSSDLENAAKNAPETSLETNSETGTWSPKSPAERILMALKMRGEQSISALGAGLGITGEAVRQQLQRLLEDGLVEARGQPAGVGRPTRIWRLTGAGQRRFPDTHAALTVQLLDIVRANLGEAVLETIIAAREAQTRSAYEAALAGASGIKDRVARLARLRSQEGYMADCAERPDGSLLLVENHCPICAAATACQGFCRAELEIFQAVLGPEARVERQDHIVGGGERCTYVITPDLTPDAAE